MCYDMVDIKTIYRIIVYKDRKNGDTHDNGIGGIYVKNGKKIYK